MTIVAVAIFLLTYALIATRQLRWLPIGRPAGALLGAVLTVAVGLLSPADSYAAIDHNTIALLFGMMIITAFLERAGFFSQVAQTVLTLCRTPWRLLWVLSALAALLSALLVNDTVCVFMTPIVVVTCLGARLPLGPYLIALATSANIGSAATLVGNPQNMIIGSTSGIPFGSFLLRCGPAALAGWLVNCGLLWIYYRRRLPAQFERTVSATPARRRELIWVSCVLVGVVVCFFCGLHLGFTALAGAMLLILVDRKEPAQILRRVDWALLVFFCALFIVVAGFARTGLVELGWRALADAMRLDRPLGTLHYTAVVALGSNLVSNVPMVLLAAPHVGELNGGGLGWLLLAYASTIAGNLTLVGSVANIIVAEGAKEHYRLGFREYLKFGLVSTVLVLAVGIPMIYAASWLFGPV